MNRQTGAAPPAAAQAIIRAAETRCGAGLLACHARIRRAFLDCTPLRQTMPADGKQYHASMSVGLGPSESR